MKTIETLMEMPVDARAEVIKSVAFGGDPEWHEVLRSNPQVWKSLITSIISSIQASLACADKADPPPWVHPAKSVLRRLSDSLGEAKVLIAFHTERGSYRNAIKRHRDEVLGGEDHHEANDRLWSMLSE